MNHDCNGDYFKIEDGNRFYRCLADGTVLPVPEDLPGTCPNCQRKIVTGKKEAISLPTRRFIATQVKIPSFGWCDMSWEEVPKEAS